jgi:pimeloyl-ACP methyl ester carboxylesterase
MIGMRRLRRAFLVVLLVLAAALLFFRQPDIPRERLVAKYGGAPSQFIVFQDGARAHVRDRGPRGGLALVLIHGSNASFLTWEPWVKRLVDTFRVITVDMPAHGLTGAVPDQNYSQDGMVKFVGKVADALELSRFAVGGHSMGGRVGARFAEEYPARVSHLILVGASGLPFKEAGPTPLAFRIAATPVLNRLMLYITPRSIVINGLQDAISNKEIITNEMIESYWDFARMEGTRAATIRRLNTPNDGVKDRIGEIKAPTLILWGAEDRVIPVEVGDEFHRLIPGSKLVVYPGIGHIPQEEASEESAAEVREFLRGDGN